MEVEMCGPPEIHLPDPAQPGPTGLGSGFQKLVGLGRVRVSKTKIRAGPTLFVFFKKCENLKNNLKKNCSTVRE